MSLNSEQMLPARVRGMRQMKELLGAEDAVLAELERILDEMYQRASQLHEELVNEEWLERKLQGLTGGIVDVAAWPEELLVEVMINRGNLSSIDSETVIAFLDKWLPAHLVYRIIYEQLLCAVNRHAAVWQDDEIMVLRQVVI